MITNQLENFSKKQIVKKYLNRIHDCDYEEWILHSSTKENYNCDLMSQPIICDYACMWVHVSMRVHVSMWVHVICDNATHSTEKRH